MRHTQPPGLTTVRTRLRQCLAPGTVHTDRNQCNVVFIRETLHHLCKLTIQCIIPPVKEKQPVLTGQLTNGSHLTVLVSLQLQRNCAVVMAVLQVVIQLRMHQQGFGGHGTEATGLAGPEVLHLHVGRKILHCRVENGGIQPLLRHSLKDLHLCCRRKRCQGNSGRWRRFRLILFLRFVVPVPAHYRFVHISADRFTLRNCLTGYQQTYCRNQIQHRRLHVTAPFLRTAAAPKQPALSHVQPVRCLTEWWYQRSGHCRSY